MIAGWRIWMKLLLAIGLIVGCNSILPGLAAASVQAVTAGHGDCHDMDRKGSPGGAPGGTMCKASCLAVPLDLAGVPRMAFSKAPPEPTPLRRLMTRESAPDTPPPRG